MCGRASYSVLVADMEDTTKFETSWTKQRILDKIAERGFGIEFHVDEAANGPPAGDALFALYSAMVEIVRVLGQEDSKVVTHLRTLIPSDAVIPEAPAENDEHFDERVKDARAIVQQRPSRVVWDLLCSAAEHDEHQWNDVFPKEERDKCFDDDREQIVDEQGMVV